MWALDRKLFASVIEVAGSNGNASPAITKSNWLCPPLRLTVFLLNPARSTGYYRRMRGDEIRINKGDPVPQLQFDHYTYCLIDTGRKTIYVGLSRSRSRIKRHLGKPWTIGIIRPYSTEDEAAAAERMLIHRYHPTFNKVCYVCDRKDGAMGHTRYRSRAQRGSVTVPAAESFPRGFLRLHIIKRHPHLSLAPNRDHLQDHELDHERFIFRDHEHLPGYR